MNMQLVSMKMDVKEAQGYASAPTLVGDAPAYPYGLCLCLNDETLKKLGLDMLEVGTPVTVTAKATVTRASAMQEQDGGTEIGMDLQITDLAVVPPAEDNARAKRLYQDAD